MQQIYKMIFPQLANTSKVWVYAANRPLTAEEQNNLRSDLQKFIGEWAAHGDLLYGAGDILNDYFLVLAVDESQVLASGCSIDTSVRFVKELGVRYGVDFLNRMYVLIENNGQLERIHFADLANYPDANIFNPTVSTLGELRSSWLVPVSDFTFA